MVNVLDLISVLITKDIHLFPSIFFCFHIENVEVFYNWVIVDKGLLKKNTKRIILTPPVRFVSLTCFFHVLLVILHG